MSALQRTVAGTRAQLLGLGGQVQIANTRVAQLEVIQQRDEQALGQVLVGVYESGRPDLANVVLEASGFANVLERLTFAREIARQDARAVARVRAARAAVAQEATRLGALTTSQRQASHDELSLLARIKKTKAAFVSHRTMRADGPRPISFSKLGAAAGRAMPATAGLAFPLPRGGVSPPATWSVGEGVNIPTPAGTPEVAACAGTIVLHGVGGLGSSAPVLRCNRPVSGYEYVYYGDAGSNPWTPIGTPVGQGQEIAVVGAGSIGAYAGPDLQIGFADASGSPLGSSSAAAMAALLRAAYRG